MTTVVLTPTHIASDHCKIILNTGKETVIDESHKKIFVDPNKKFIFATEGTFDPEIIEMASSQELFLALLEFIEVNYKNKPFEITDQEQLREFLTLVTDGRCFLISNTKRFRIKHYNDKLTVSECAEYEALGSGGNFAVGLLIGGISVFDIWSYMDKFDHGTSQEHTVISLDILKDQ